MSFGTVVRSGREARGLSLSAIAKALGVTKVYVSDVERGLRAPFTREKLEKVAEVLELDPVELHELAADHRGYVRLPYSAEDRDKNRLAAVLSHRWVEMDGDEVVKIMGAL